jgi:hypothetical protein
LGRARSYFIILGEGGPGFIHDSLAQLGRASTFAVAFSPLDYAELPYWSMLLYYFKVEGTSFLLVYSTMSLDNILFIKKHLNLGMLPSKTNISEIMYFFWISPFWGDFSLGVPLRFVPKNGYYSPNSTPKNTTELKTTWGSQMTWMQSSHVHWKKDPFYIKASPWHPVLAWSSFFWDINKINHCQIELKYKIIFIWRQINKYSLIMSHFWQGQVIFYYFRGRGSSIYPRQLGRASTFALAFSPLDYAELPYWSMLLYYFKVEGTSFLLVYSTMSLDNILFYQEAFKPGDAAFKNEHFW